MNRRIHRHPNCKGFRRRRLLFESLELRLSPALLIPGAEAAAFSDRQGIQMGPTTNSDPAHAVAATAVGPVLTFLPQPFQESADAEATTPGPVLGRSSSGGVFPGTPNATDDCSISTAGQLSILPGQASTPSATVSCSAAKATSNWVVIGVPGRMVDVDVQIQIAGYLETVDHAGAPVSSSVFASLLLAPDQSPTATLFDAGATLTNGALRQRSGPWTFSQVAGQPTRYETNHASSVTFTIPTGEPFSLQAALNTLARSDGPFELFGFSDFSNTGFSYTVSTSDPGATVHQLSAVELGAIQGAVFEDRDSDGQFDSNESGVSGRWLYLDANANGLRDSGETAVQSDSIGAFQFDSLAAGTYRVMQELPGGWIQTAPPGTAPWIVTINRNQVSTGHDFGAFRLPGSIDGTVRLRQGGGLPADIVEGIRVYLDSDGDHRFDATEPNTLTDGLGDFQFPDLYPGRYDVKLVLPSGASQVFPNYFTERGHVVNLGPTEQRHVKFELADAGSISGTKFLDKNSNGVVEFGEPQIGQLIFIDYNRDGMLDDTEPRTITDSLGQYRFDNLPPGSYWLRDFAGQVIPAPDPANNRSFGHAGVFAGDSLIIADPDAMAMNPATGQMEPIGRVYVVDMTSGNVTELAGPTPTGGSGLRENFGWSIAVNDTTIAVGSPVTDFDDTIFPAGIFATTTDGDQLLIVDERFGTATPVAGLADELRQFDYTCPFNLCNPILASSINSIDFDAAGNLLAAISVNAGAEDHRRDDTYILWINASSGQLMAVSTQFLLTDLTVTALEVHPISGSLYATVLPDADPTSSLLMELPLHPGGSVSVIRVIGPTNLGRIGGLAIDNQGRFFVVESGSGLLAELDPRTGAATPIATTGFSDVASLEFDPSYTYMLAGLGEDENVQPNDAGIPGHLVSITREGAGTLIGPSGFNDLSGLSFRLRRLADDLVGTEDDGGYRMRDLQPRPESSGHVYLFDKTTGLIQGRLDSPLDGHAYGVSLASLGLHGFAIGAPAVPQGLSAGYVDLVRSDGSFVTRLASDEPGPPGPFTFRWGQFGLPLAATFDSLMVREHSFIKYHVNDPILRDRYLLYDHTGQLLREENSVVDLRSWLPTLAPQGFDYLAIGDVGTGPPYGPGPGVRDIDLGVTTCGGQRSGELLQEDDKPQGPPVSVVGLQGNLAAVGYPADNRVLTFVDEYCNPGAGGRPYYIPWHFVSDRIQLPAAFAQVDSQFGYSLAVDATGTRLLIGDPGGDQSPGQAFVVGIGQHIDVTGNTTGQLVFRTLYPDRDGDGVGDPVEDGAPNQGDGNGDGIRDSYQPNVASLLNAVTRDYVTLAAPDDLYLKYVVAHRDVPAYQLPTPDSFPLGFFEFNVERNWPHRDEDSLGLTDVELWDHSGNSYLTTPEPTTFHRVGASNAGRRWIRNLQDEPGNPLVFQINGNGLAPGAAVGVFGGPSDGPIAVYRVAEFSSPPAPPIIENNPWFLEFEAGLTSWNGDTVGVDWDNNGTIDQTAIHRGPGITLTPSARFSGPDLPAGNNTIRFLIDPDGIAQEYFHTVYVEGEFDNDDVLDVIEDAAPNNGDGNNDGVPDSQQPNVVSLPNAVDGSYITLVAPTGTLFRSVTALTPDSSGLPAPPPNLQFPIGLVDFRLHAVPADTEIAVQMIVHGAVVPQSYYKLTYQGWVDFGYEGRTGATFAGNVITLHFIDNYRGDGDSLPFRIHDPGGPAVLPQPTLLVDGPDTGVRGQSLKFTFTTDMAGTYTYDIDWDGDGTVDQSIEGGERLSVEQVFVANGDVLAVFTANAADRPSSDPVTHAVSIDIAAVIDGNLVVGGTADDDRIRFYRTGQRGVSVRVNRDRFGPFPLSVDAKLIAHGQDGDDRIHVTGSLRHDASLFGGAGRDLMFGGRGNDLLDGGPGHDRLYGLHGDDLLDGGDGDDWLVGGPGDNVLLGGEGNDLLFGGIGWDLLIGGAGADRLYGGFGEDLLIGGSTVYDNDRDSLRQILALWTLPLSHPERVERLRDQSQSVYLKLGETVLDDESVDRLFGGFGEDWFFFRLGQDRLIGHRHGESVN